MTVKTVKSSGGDYTTIALAMAACPANLVTSTQTWEIEVYASAGVQNVVNVTGITTNSTYYVRIYAPTAERHLGKPDTTSVRIDSNGYEYGIHCSVANLIVEGIQFTTGSLLQGGILYDYTGASSGLIVKECLFNFGAAPYPCINLSGPTGGTINARNNIAYLNATGAASTFINNGTGSGYTTYVFNNTVVSRYTGAYGELIKRAVGTMVATNNIALFTAPGTGPSAFAGTITQSYNASSDSTASGTGSQTSSSPSFTDAANGDFHITSATGLTGTDLSADANFPFSTDIDGQTRSGTWHMGADQLASTQSQAPRSMHHFNQMRA
jgi:hypothetical protein